MLQPACVELQNILCQRISQKLGSISVRKFIRYTSTRCLGCQRQILKDLQRGDINFTTQINKLGFVSSSLLNKYEKFSVTQKRSSQSGNNEPPSGGGSSPDGMFAAPRGNRKDGSPAVSSNTETGMETSEGKPQKITKMTKKKAFDYSNYTTNIYILPIRALTEYLLELKDIENIPKYMRRSPYQYGEMITVFKRSEVEKVAIEKWGSLEYIKEKKRIQATHGYNQFGYDSSPLRQQFETIGGTLPPLFDEPVSKKEQESFLKSGSAKVVLVAVTINAFNCIVKFIAWQMTGSDSMFSEFLHSGADTFNQVILAFGLYKSMKQPDSGHPYGYTNLRYISSLMSGLMIFFLGAGYSCSHAVHGFLHPNLMHFNIWAIGTLIFSFVSESFSLAVAVNQARKSAKLKKKKFWEYVKGGEDPNVNVVLLEDLAAVSGVTIAAACMSAAHFFQNSYFDSSGSVLIGGVLAYVAWFIIRTNSSALIGRSITLEKKSQITQELEQDRMIRSVHDVKATEMGGEIRYKAEVDFDGREMTLAHLDTTDLDNLMREMQEVKTTDDVVNIMLNHGEKIVSRPGEEIDRIEKTLKSKHPDLRHVDLEAL